MKSSIYIFLFSFLFLAACEKESDPPFLGNIEAATEVHSQIEGKTLTSIKGKLKITDTKVSFHDDDGVVHAFEIESIIGGMVADVPKAEYTGEGYVLFALPGENGGDKFVWVTAKLNDVEILDQITFLY